MTKTPLCPKCVNVFLITAAVEDLADEIICLHEKPEDVVYQLCENHKSGNLFRELSDARNATRVAHELLMQQLIEEIREETKNETSH